MYVRPFAETSLRDRTTVGGKGASLGELTRAGINIPPGFTLTTAAFEQFMASIDRDGAIRRLIAALDPTELTALAAATAAVRQQIERAPLPEEIVGAITTAYAALTGDPSEATSDASCQGRRTQVAEGRHPAHSAPVAIRSSATSEDSAEASFAGLQDSFLWVRDTASVLHAVRACWASLYSTESVSYRLRLKLPEARVAMGVVIQRMVESACSGVMFTRSPTTGDRSVIAIEGSWGLGSCIVSGEVTPDKFVVSKVTGEISKRTVSEKRIQHSPRHDASGVRAEEVPVERQSTPCLTDAEIVALAQIGKQIERHYGTPQDIEWAIGADPPHCGPPHTRLFILQSRPETVWASREAQPVATPKARAFDHVLALLGGRDRSP